jgi:hypothetical protein
MWCNSTAYWTVKINGASITNPTITNDKCYTYIYFTYHQSTDQVQIASTSAVTVPEFQQVMLLLMAATTMAVLLYRKKQLK